MFWNCVNPGKRGIVILVLFLTVIAAPVTAAVYFTTSAPEIITKGDPFSISGTGAVNGTVGIWIIGRDHFEVLTSTPDRHGNFSIPSYTRTRVKVGSLRLRGEPTSMGASSS